MIFAHGEIMPDGARPALLSALEAEINATRRRETLSPETVLGAIGAMGRRLEAGEFNSLLAQYAPAGVGPGDLLPLLRRETWEARLNNELGPEPFAPRTFEETTARTLPLGTLLHVAPGNQPGLPVYSVLEGLITGNVNLLKLPRSDKGLSLAALKLLTDQEPGLAPFIYAFDLPSEDAGTLGALAALADGIVVWGGDGAVEGMRRLAPPGCKLMEWGHRLSFAYIAGYEDRDAELVALARHVIQTGGRLCSSCQVIYLDTDSREEGERFCKAFLPYLSAAALSRPGAPFGGGAQATLSGHTARLERIVEGRADEETVYPGRGCSVIFRPDSELELSPMEGNVYVKLLPRAGLVDTLRRQKGRLQTAGLLCAPQDREELTGLLCRAGLTRVTRAGTLSDPFPNEGHDGEYPLRRYVRVVDVET